MHTEGYEKQLTEKKEAVLAAGISEFARKSYMEVKTDTIVKKCGISKGLLFHYYGSKKKFYLCCLSRALETLTRTEEAVQKPESLQRKGTFREEFYDILFTAIDKKMKLCVQYPEETHFTNMASKETAAEVVEEKNRIIMRYAAQMHMESEAVMEKAVRALPLKAQEDDKRSRKITEGLLLYTRTIINKYLLAYQDTPDEFFINAGTVKAELREYIDIMLYGIL